MSSAGWEQLHDFWTHRKRKRFCPPIAASPCALRQTKGLETGFANCSDKSATRYRQNRRWADGGRRSAKTTKLYFILLRLTKTSPALDAGGAPYLDSAVLILWDATWRHWTLREWAIAVSLEMSGRGRGAKFWESLAEKGLKRKKEPAR